MTSNGSPRSENWLVLSCLAALCALGPAVGAAAAPPAFSVLSISRSNPPPAGLQSISMSVKRGRIELAKNTDGFAPPATRARLGLFRVEWTAGKNPEADSLVEEILRERDTYLARQTTIETLMQQVYGRSRGLEKIRQGHKPVPHSLQFAWEGALLDESASQTPALQGKFFDWFTRTEQLNGLRAVDAVEVAFGAAGKAPALRELAGKPHSLSKCRETSPRIHECMVTGLGIARIRKP